MRVNARLIAAGGYAVYDAIVARWRQTCLAHILRTAKEIAAEIQLIKDPVPYQSDIDFANAIAEFFSDVCALDRKKRAGRLSRKRARATIPSLRRRLKTLHLPQTPRHTANQQPCGTRASRSGDLA